MVNIVGCYSGDFSENQKIGNQGRKKQSSQTGIDTVSQSTYKSYLR